MGQFIISFAQGNGTLRREGGLGTLSRSIPEKGERLLGIFQRNDQAEAARSNDNQG